MHTRKATLWAARYRWAELLRRIYEVDPLAYPRCAAPMRIVAVLTDPAVITRILAHRPAASLARRRPARILRPGRRKFLLNQWQAWEALIPSAVSLYIARRIKCRITCQSHNTERGGLVNMRTRLFSVVGLAFLLVAAARPAHAQAWQFGPQLSFADKHFHLGIGARAVLDLERLAPSVKNVSIIGTFDYFFPDVSGKRSCQQVCKRRQAAILLGSGVTATPSL